MNEQDKQKYLEDYKKAKEKGEFFFPDAVFKDAIVSLIIFVLLVTLAYFVGAPLEERANPADTSYTPRPEWYFLFLFQLLKYFPGNLEVVAVFLIPTLLVILLFALPFIDRSRMRHFLNRKLIAGGTVFVLLGVVVLTVLAVKEAPPPVEQVAGDQTAVLYTQNCAGCHGTMIDVPVGINLHDIIAQGNHEGMPPWSADLTNEQIDALAGFILSPVGNQLFLDNCSECHEVSDLVAENPLELKKALDGGTNYIGHNDVEIPNWPDVMTVEERTALLNFLIAPDGKRLFDTNCSACHGSSISFSGDESELRQTIKEGGLHLEMPAWRESLSGDQITVLAEYVVSPEDSQDGAQLYEQYCTACHFERIPRAASFDEAYDIISTGGPHETMPVWGQILTDEQVDALTSYVLETLGGSQIELGSQIFQDNCSSCHGEFGEGGPNPSRPSDVIAPISTAEYLKTRDDFTLRAVISQGQPNFGMSPFELSEGGPLDNEEIDAVVAFIRSWQSSPPVELPPEIATSSVSLSGAEIYKSVCAQCHGPAMEGGVGPSLRSKEFQENNTAEDIFTSISEGHPATPMIAWGEILSSQQIEDLVKFISQQPQIEEGEQASGEVSFAAMVLPLFESSCAGCHGESTALGGWISTNYDDVMNSGENGPVVIPGDVENSLLAQKLSNTQEIGGMMPPGGWDNDSIQIVLDWIEAGAQDN